ncbi:sulfurtransferase-like selenium metabolism protein YedF [Carboxydothermus hydrogenoformans]|uniref:Uncharacterized protein n=1 Tax=Carboxydothermus hydrogenoformans (strain ATCC BAA-161 / DSM 6008 / Z-2901) TaxID=246194 RepID=Q3AER7_CARHZ|nr:sulfurtransferase-like selenium metabolism protein YedF [Carboxydothermus hydrogenoformans]ABB14195.1 conserved hypothetical protein [Carboxydothermus hydrogenoformans Z-2901]
MDIYELAAKLSPFFARKEEIAGTVLFIQGESLGRGDEELGKILMKNFLTTLAGNDELPEALLFVNSGVKLVVEGSPVLGPLKILEEKGVYLGACGTCLDYFKLKDKVVAGEVTNMGNIVNYLTKSLKVVSL